jgi:transcriptional regulator with XRE-family HTH domain
MVVGGIIAGMAKKRKTQSAARSTGPLFLAEWMKELDVDGNELARRLGVSYTTVWRWQESPTRLNPLKQAQVAKALGIWPGCLWMHPADKAMRMIRLFLEEETTPEK